MRYAIRLNVDYDFGAPSAHARSVAHLLPRDIAAQQRVLARLLVIDPRPDARRDITDFFGNTRSLLYFHASIDRIALTLNAEVERASTDRRLDLSPDPADLRQDIAAHLSLGPDAPHHYLGASARVPEDPAITAFARDCARQGMTVLQIAECLGAALHAEMRFDPEATDVHTPATEAFANRHGVCQDFSHIMIAGLRGLGIPAGYVSGFLRTTPPPGQPRLEGADAMHAWVTLFCGAQLGWVEYDPTNGCLVERDHIVVAFGRDYSDVAPVKGVLHTSGSQTSKHSVDVVPLT